MQLWEPDKWLISGGCSKQQAITALQTKMDKDGIRDGVFLIRPSESKPGFHALSVSCKGRIFHCLVEYRPPDTGEGIIDDFVDSRVLFSPIECSKFERAPAFLSRLPMPTRIAFLLYKMHSSNIVNNVRLLSFILTLNR